jgi:hypothetical protein
VNWPQTLSISCDGGAGMVGMIMVVTVSPPPGKVCKVFEVETLSLDLGVDFGLEAKARWWRS